MSPLNTLRTWLHSPSKRRRAPHALECHRLEDRTTPATTDKIFAQPVDLSKLATTQDLLARSTSANPLQDLQNIVRYYNLGTVIDLGASGLAVNYGSAKLLQIRLTPTADAKTVAKTLTLSNAFAFVSPNYIYPAGDGRGLVEQTPNDPQFPNQYQHGIIGSPTAWDVSTGSSTVIVALLDDGVDITHPDLSATAWTNAGEIAGNGIDDDGNGFTDDIHGWDFVHNTNSVLPDDGTLDVHGTEVAGLLAGSFNNGTGIAGVAGAGRYLPLKVIGNGPTTSLTIARAVNYALDRGAKIINNSFNIDGFVEDPVFQAAVNSAYDNGALWINSAGNLNLKDPPRARLDGMILVSATDRNDTKASYSNYGFGIDISAPGGTASDPFITTLPGGGYGPAFGSSMAAPLVAGTAALVWSAHAGYSRDQVASAILANAANLEALNPGYIDLLGTGRLNASKAVSGDPFVTKLGRVYGLPPEGTNAPAGFDHFSVRLVGNLDPNTVVIGNFELRWAGLDNLFGTNDDALVNLRLDNQDDYRFGTNALQFSFDSLFGEGLYRFTGYSGGLADPFHAPVDGDGDGVSGGNLVRHFGTPRRIHGHVTWDTDEDGDEPPTSPPQPPIPNPPAGNPGGPPALPPGVFVDLDGDGIWDVDPFTSPPGPLLIGDGGSATLPVVVTGSDDPISAVTVSILVTHGTPSELEIIVVSPDGTTVRLIRNRMLPIGVPADSRKIEFDDNFIEAINASTGLVQYRLKPEEALAKFRGHTANGTWQVIVRDTTAGDAGLLVSATLSISREPVAFADANGRYELDAPTQTFNVLPLIPAGWQVTPGTPPVKGVDPTRDPNLPINFNLVPKTGLSGRVIDDVNHVGVAGATVTINGVTTATDANGNYLVPGLAAGSYGVSVTAPAGYSTVAAQTVSLTATQPHRSVEFHVQRDTAPVVVTVTPVTPTVRTTKVDSIAFGLSEPLSNLKLSDLRLTRDGAPVNLAGATLIGSGTAYVLIGLSTVATADGAYTFTVLAPAPVGQPGREPVPVVTTWTLDATPPMATLAPTAGPHGVVNQITVHFNSLVNGLDLTDFVLKRGNVVVPLNGVSLSPSGTADFTLLNLSAIASTAGTYTLTLNGPGISDAAGNVMAQAATVTWTVPVRPVRYTAVGAGEGSSPSVAVLDGDGVIVRRLTPFDSAYTGGVRVATGDVNGDAVDDVIVSMGRGAGPRVKIYDGATFAVVADYFVFEAGFTGGVFVAAGDVTGDGVAELIATPDRGGGPRVRVLNALSGTTVADFFGIQDVNFRGGARASLGDVTGDGRLDVVVAAGTGGGPRIAVFDGVSVAANVPTKPFGDFLAFESNLRNGAYVTVADINGDGRADIIAGAGDGGGPRLTAFSGAALMNHQTVKLADFFVGSTSSRGGLRLAVDDLDNDGVKELIVGPGSGVGSRIRVYAAHNLITQSNPETMREFDPFGGFLGGVYLG